MVGSNENNSNETSNALQGLPQARATTSIPLPVTPAYACAKSNDSVDTRRIENRIARVNMDNCSKTTSNVLITEARQGPVRNTVGLVTSTGWTTENAKAMNFNNVSKSTTSINNVGLLGTHIGSATAGFEFRRTTVDPFKRTRTHGRLETDTCGVPPSVMNGSILATKMGQVAAEYSLMRNTPQPGDLVETSQADTHAITTHTDQKAGGCTSQPTTINTKIDSLTTHTDKAATGFEFRRNTIGPIINSGWTKEYRLSRESMVNDSQLGLTNNLGLLASPVKLTECDKRIPVTNIGWKKDANLARDVETISQPLTHVLTKQTGYDLTEFECFNGNNSDLVTAMGSTKQRSIARDVKNVPISPTNLLTTQTLPDATSCDIRQNTVGLNTNMGLTHSNSTARNAQDVSQCVNDLQHTQIRPGPIEYDLGRNTVRLGKDSIKDANEQSSHCVDKTHLLHYIILHKTDTTTSSTSPVTSSCNNVSTKSKFIENPMINAQGHTILGSPLSKIRLRVPPNTLQPSPPSMYVKEVQGHSVLPMVIASSSSKGDGDTWCAQEKLLRNLRKSEMMYSIPTATNNQIQLYPYPYMAAAPAEKSSHVDKDMPRSLHVKSGDPKLNLGLGDNLLPGEFRIN